jgi:hypothetical protein
MSAISITWLIMSILWSIVGIMTLFSFTKIENEKTKKYVFTQYLIILVVLIINLVCNIFR